MKYKTLSHTADLRLEVYGTSLEDLFGNAASALAEILAPKMTKFKIQKSKVKIKVSSDNLNILLVDFLNEILAKSNINKAVYQVSSVRCQVSSVKKKAEIEAEIIGIPVKEFEEDIKAVTYHEAEVKMVRQAHHREGGIWKAKLVLDI